MHIRTAIAAIFAGLLLLAACSSSGDSVDQATDEADESSEDGGDGGDGGDILTGLVEEDCDFVLDALFAGPILAAEPGEEGEVVDRFGQIAEEAPDEIRGDLELIADAHGAFFDNVDLDDPTTFEDALEVFDSDAAIEASVNVTEYFEENCE